MTDLFLIAHKVRGEPAFDVACKMECPVCHDANSCGDYEGSACNECEGEGFWWIIPTSGHRAYPYDWRPIQDTTWLQPLPPSLPDHYPTSASPSRPSLASLIPPVKIHRRF